MKRILLFLSLSLLAACSSPTSSPQESACPCGAQGNACPCCQKAHPEQQGGKAYQALTIATQ